MTGIVTRLRRLVARPLPPKRAALASLELGIDKDWYLKTYPDVAASGLDPVEHFLRRGAWEGRRHNRYFDPIWYVQRHADASGQLPILHYALQGRRKRYDPGPAFSASAYLRAYPDVAENGMDPLDHYIRHGQHEQRTITAVHAILEQPERSGEPKRTAPRLSDDEIPGNETLARVQEVFARRGATIEPRS